MPLRILLTVLMTMLTVFAARGDEPAGPIPSNGQCVVTADEQWTRQERFVWSRVCIGGVADLNGEPEFGGDLDPKRPEGLPDNRILRSAFIETILLADKYRHALTRNGVHIVGARFKELLDLSGAELTNELWLDSSLLEKGADLSKVKSNHPINFYRSRISERLLLTDARIDGDLTIRRSVVTDVEAEASHIGGDLNLDQSEFTGNLDLSLIRLTGSLDLSESKLGNTSLLGSQIGSAVALYNTKSLGKLTVAYSETDGYFSIVQSQLAELIAAGAVVHGPMAIVDTQVTGEANFAATQVGGNLAMNGKSEFASLRLTNARLLANLALDGVKVKGTLDMINLRLDGALDMSGGAEYAEVDMKNAHVGSFVALNGSKVHGQLSMLMARIDGALQFNDAEFTDVSMLDARVGGLLNLRRSKVTGKLDLESIQVNGDVFLNLGAEFSGPVDLVFSNVGELEMADGTFHGDVDITGGEIRSDLVLGPPSTRWVDGAALILNNAKCNAVQDTNDAWPTKLDLTGFTYHSLGGLHPDEHDRMSDRAVKWYRNWLGRQPYSPQPYVQLAAALRESGRPDAADDILYAGRQRERQRAAWPQRIWLTALDWSVGYGYHVERALYWVVGFIIAGVIALRLSGEGRRHGMPYGFAYSFDLLLPIIRLREMHYSVELNGWSRYYFYLHKIMGYVLASFLIVGLSGMVK